VSKSERDLERGQAVAAQLKKQGVSGALIRAAEQGYITQLECMMETCFCPDELGGASHFEPRTDDPRHWTNDWTPTVEHYPIPARDKGKETVNNVILAHRLCNRIDYSMKQDRAYESDLARIEKARDEGIRRKSEGS
jgi:hypothetical protein